MKKNERPQAVSVSVGLDVPVERSWEILQDFSVAHHYVPRLTGIEIVSECKSGMGAHRRVYSGKRYLEETVIEWRPPGGFTIALHKGDRPMPPFRRAEFEYRICAAQSGQTRMTLTMRVVMPGGETGKKVARWLILPLIRKNLVQVAAGAKHYYETGKAASDADRRRLADAVEVLPAST